MTYTVTGTGGCVNVATRTIQVLPNTGSSVSDTICEGQAFVFGSQNLTNPGVYTRTIQASNGCDSVITLNLFVKPYNAIVLSGSSVSSTGVLTVTNSGVGGQNISTSIGSVNGSVGDTVFVPVTINMASGISTAAISMAIGYDPTKLQCISSVTSLNSNIATGFLSNCGVFSGASQFRAAWFNLTPVSFSGVMFNVRFRILAAGTHALAWDLATPGNCEYADDLADVIPNTNWTNGSVVVGQGGGGTPPVTTGCSMNLTSSTWTATQTAGVNTPIQIIQYQTTGATGAVFSGLPTGVSGTWSNNTVTISGTPLSTGTYAYSVALTGGACYNGSDSQTLCLGQPIQSIGYSTSGATGAVISGLPAGVTGQWSNNRVTIEGTPTVTGIFTYTVAMTGGCIGGPNNSTTGVLEIRPLNTIALASGPATQNACINQPITPITYTTTGATGATVSGLPSGVTSQWSNNVLTITGSTSSTGIFQFTATMVGGCVSGTSAVIGVLNVRPNPLSTIHDTICEGQAFVFGSQNLTNPGVYTRTIQASNGCDSVITLNLFVKPYNAIVLSGSSVSSTGVLTVTNSGVGGQNISTSIGSVNGSVGDTVFVPVTINMASGISTAAISMAIGYDPTKLQCISSVTSLNSNIATGFLSNCGVFSGASQFRAAWFNLTPVSFSGVMFNVRFRILAAGTHALAWDLATPGNCEYADDLADVIPNTNWTNGSVVVGQGGGGTPPVTTGCSMNLTSSTWTATQTAGVNTPIQIIQYQTTGATGAVFSGLPTGVSGTWSNNTVTISGTPLSTGTYAYSVALTGGACYNGSDSQTLCLGQPIQSIGYSTSGATGAVISGLPAGVTGQWSNNRVTIEGTPTVTGIFTYTVAMTGGCIGGPNNSTTGVLEIRPLNTIALASGPATQNACINQPITPITYTTTGATGATVSGLPFGVNGLWINNSLVISGTPIESGTYMYEISLLGGCLSTMATTSGSLVVNPSNIFYQISPSTTSNQQIIGGSAIQEIKYRMLGQSSYIVLGLPQGVIHAINDDTLMISGRPELPGSFNFSVVQLGGCNTVDSVMSGTLTILSPIEIQANGDSVICEGSSLVLNANYSEGFSYQWTKDNLPISGAYFADYIVTAPGLYRLRYSSPNFTGTSNTITVSINPSCIAISMGSASGCSGDTLTVPISHGVLASFSGFNLRLLFDPSKVNYVGHQPGITVLPGMYVTGNNQSGQVNIGYFGNIQQIAVSGILAYLRFVGSTSAELFWDSISNPSTVYDLNLDPLPVQFIGGELRLDRPDSAFYLLKATICEGDQYNLNGQTFSSTGSFVYGRIPSSSFSRCDTILRLDLTVLPRVTILPNVTTCQNVPFVFGGNPLVSSGTYRDTLVNYLGCDSIIQLSLTALPTHQIYVQRYACAPLGYQFGSQTLTTSGHYSQLFTNSSGCDSLVNLQLTIVDSLNVVSTSGNLTYCPFDSLQLTLPDTISGAYYEWLRNGQILQGFNGPTLTVYEEGIYRLRALISNQGCEVYSNSLQIQMINCNRLFGNLRYDNVNQSPLVGVPVSLKTMLGNVVSRDTTDSVGYFNFPGYANGNYFLDANINYLPGGINATDALFVQRYFTFLLNLSPLRKLAGDVNIVQSLNSTDALLIQRNTAGLLSVFSAGQFALERPSITAVGNPIALQPRVLSYGDVNGSYPVFLAPSVLVLDTTFQTLQGSAFASVRFTTRGSGVYERGVCWSSSPNPTINASRISFGKGSFDFSTSFHTSLNAGSTYYVRAYARTANAIYYSNQRQFVAHSFAP